MPTRFFHGFADAMAKEPSGLHGAAKGPLKLAGRDALFAAAHQIDGLQPDMHRGVAGLEDGPDADGELFPACVALPQAWTAGLAAKPSGLPYHAALWAGRTIWPELAFHVGEGGFLIMEPRGGKLGLHGGYLPGPRY